jgi:hypothetical protein
MLGVTIHNELEARLRQAYLSYSDRSLDHQSVYFTDHPNSIIRSF